MRSRGKWENVTVEGMLLRSDNAVSSAAQVGHVRVFWKGEVDQIVSTRGPTQQKHVMNVGEG